MRRAKKEWEVYIRIAVTAGILYLCIHYWDSVICGAGRLIKAALPLLFGALIAYIVNILMGFYERYYVRICKWSLIRRYRRPVCMMLAFLSVFLVLSVLWQLICPVFIDCLFVFAEKLPATLDEFAGWLSEVSPECCDMLGRAGFMQDGTIEWEFLMKRLTAVYFHPAGGVMESVLGVFTGILSGFFMLFLGLIFSVYLLFRKEKIAKDIRWLLKRKLGKKQMQSLWYFFHIMDHSFRRFIIGQFAEAVILGGLCMIGMLLFGFPYAVMIGSLIGVTALIPLAGAYIGALVGAVMIYTESPVQALFFLFFLAVLQQVEGNIIYPRVVGSSLGLPGIWVLAAVILGGSLWGIAGIFLGVPLTAAGYRILQDYMKKNRMRI